MNTEQRSRRLRPAAAAALALVLAGLAACGDDGATEAGTSSTDTAATLDISAADYRFENVPASVGATTQLSLRNESSREVHELVAMRLPDDEQRTAKELTALPQQELGGLFAGPPALVLVAPPNDKGFIAVGDGKLGAPGRYLLVCFIPTGADPTAYLDAAKASSGPPPSVPGGPPHFANGMFAEVTVR